MSPELKKAIEEKFGAFDVNAPGPHNKWYYPHGKSPSEWFLVQFNDGMFSLRSDLWLIGREWTEQELIKILRLYAFT